MPRTGGGQGLVIKACNGYAPGGRDLRIHHERDAGDRLDIHTLSVHIAQPCLHLRWQREPSLTGARSPRLRRRRGHSLTCPLPLPLILGYSEDRQLPRLLQASASSYTSISLDGALTTWVRSPCIAMLGFEDSR